MSMSHHTISDRAEQFAEDAGESLREFGRLAYHRADDVKKEATKLLYGAADTIRREAREAGANREMRRNADEVAKGLERAAHYLKKRSYEDMGKDMTKNVSRNPWQTVAIVFVVGLVIGLLLRGEGQKAHVNGYQPRYEYDPYGRNQ
jgi:ElaB/YqjD/DUF883 family membrane-anchored ribosome-binding protein